MTGDPRVLIVDLNNFARYPTVAVGYLAAILREAEMRVEVLSPLAHGVPGVPREPRVRPWSLIDEQLRYRTAVSSRRTTRRLREKLAALRSPIRGAARRRLLAEFEARLTGGFDAVLVSTYLMYHEICAELVARCKAADVPILLGGSYLNVPEIMKDWAELDGVAGIVGGELEPVLPELVRTVVSRKPLDSFPGVWVPHGAPPRTAPPLRSLDAIPFPDYSDFPWHAYPNRITPILTGRGCGWGVCTFCSDVTSSTGRTFRSRSPGNVLEELSHQADRQRSSLFVFTDLKLNSDIGVWHAILDELPSRLPDARWIAAVHVGARRDDGLSLDELRAARSAGMARVTTGIESGSQRVLDSMAKGTSLQETSMFLRDAAAAGISVRATMILGYPGERAVDVDASARFLEAHASSIDRVTLNRFSIMTGTIFHRRLREGRAPVGLLDSLAERHRFGVVDHRYVASEDPDYHRAARRLLARVHEINRKRLSGEAHEFDGVM